MGDILGTTNITVEMYYEAQDWLKHLDELQKNAATFEEWKRLERVKQSPRRVLQLAKSVDF